MTEFECQIKALSKLITGWNLISVDSNSQFDDFSTKVLFALNNGENSEKVRRIIESELIVTFGLFNNEFDSDVLVSQIIEWWGN